MKMKRLAFAILLLAYWLSPDKIQAHEIDSLLLALPKVESGQLRIDLLNTLARAYALISVTEAEKFATQAIGQSREVNYNAGLAEGFKILGSTYYVKGEHD